MEILPSVLCAISFVLFIGIIFWLGRSDGHNVQEFNAQKKFKQALNLSRAGMFTGSDFILVVDDVVHEFLALGEKGQAIRAYQLLMNMDDEKTATEEVEKISQKFKV